MGLLDNLRNNPAPDGQSGEDFAPSWRWEQAGDGVEGTIITISSRIHDNHPEGYPIVTVRQDNGEDLAIHAMATVLKNEFNDAGLRVGDRLAVIYDGQKTSRAGRNFNAFRVAHQPGTGGVPPQAAQQPAGAPPAAQGYAAPQQGYAAPQQPAQPQYQQAPPQEVPWDGDVPPF